VFIMLSGGAAEAALEGLAAYIIDRCRGGKTR